ncbi:MAG: SxtJ family membrane protein [Bacteroidota bacterium]
MAQPVNHYSTSLVIVTGFLVLYHFFGYSWMFYTSLILGLVCVFSPFITRQIHWAWMKLGLALGWVNSRILLSVVYAVFLVPIAFLSKLGRKDQLQLKQQDRKTTYQTRDHQYKAEDLKNPF